MKRILSLLIVIVCIGQSAGAYTERDLLQKSADTQKLREILIPNQAWVSYPDYTDRAGWDKLLGKWKTEYIAQGEKYLDYQWLHINATEYLAFERTGDRDGMQVPWYKNEGAFCSLLMAELAEGKGRFLDQIINGVFYYGEMTTWSLSAHVVMQPSGRALPVLGVDVFDLFAGDVGTIMSWTYHFLHNEFSKVDPEISRRLKYEIKHRVLDSFVNGPKMGWMIERYRPGMQIINWTSWCCKNALACYLLMENDPDRLVKGVYRSMQIMDKYINYFQEDGACEEGPSYWNASPGAMFDFLQFLSDATGGKINIFHEPIIRNMGEYISRAYVGNGWVVNFSDAPTHGGGSPALAYSFGKAVGSDELVSYGAFLAQERGGNAIATGSDITRVLRANKIRDEFEQLPANRILPATAWYPQTELCYMRDTKAGLTLAAKGGYFVGGHYHCDLGSFVLYQNNVPLFIDAGSGTYTRQYFLEEYRYKLRMITSDYHSTPTINGCTQGHGNNYKTAGVSFNAKSRKMDIDLTPAYPAEAMIQQWMRSYAMTAGTLKITDSFKLKEAKTPNEVNFLTWGNVQLVSPGLVSIEVQGESATLTYDAKMFKCEVEQVDMQDPKVGKAWDNSIHRIHLTALSTPLSGKYSFAIKAKK